MKEVVFLNGKFLSGTEAKVAVSSPGLLCGWGLFETMRAYKDRIVYFSAHLERIKSAAKIIDLRFPYPLPKLKALIKKAVAMSAFGDAYVRVTLAKSEKGTDISLIIKEYEPYSLQKYRKGFQAGVSSLRQSESALAQLKTTSRLLYELSFREAKARGFDEAILLNHSGYLAEASRSNPFLVKNNALFTPALSCGCLAGITRRAVLDLAKKYAIPACEGNFSLQDLYAADEAFLTNSLIGVMPLVAVEKHRIGKGSPGALSKFFLEKYNYLLKHGD